MHLPRGKMRAAMHEHVADDSQRCGFLGEIEKRHGVAEYIAHPHEPVSGLDLELHIVYAQIVTFSRAQDQPMTAEAHRPLIRIGGPMFDPKP
jgi:hypothetical protein